MKSFQVCCIVVLVTIKGSKGDEEVKSWTDESEGWIGIDNFALQHPVSAQNDLGTASAQSPLLVIPGSTQQTNDDQRSQDTIFYPKKEHEQRIRQLAKKGDSHHVHHKTQHITPYLGPTLVTKWGGHSPEQLHPSKIDEEEDNVRQSNEPVYYAYEYKVHDPLTGDVKGHKELRDGDRVKGYYMLHDADGSMREVHYTADHEVGFTAVVSKTDDVAQPHKPSSSIFEHDFLSKKAVPKEIKNNKFQSQSNSFQYGSTKRKQPQVSYDSHRNDEPQIPNFEFPHDFHNHGKHSHSEVHIESNDEAKHVEHVRPTPSYEDAYTNFAKEQPMPVLNEDHQSYTKDDDHEDEDNDGKVDFFFNNEDFDSFDSELPFFREHSSKTPTSPIHRPHNFRPFQENNPFRRPRLQGSVPERKTKSFSRFSSNEIKPAYETYESDHERDESKSSVFVVPATELMLSAENNDKFIPFTVATDSAFNAEPSQSVLRPQIRLDQYVDDKATNQLRRMPFKEPFNNNQHSQQASERSNDFEESSFQFQRPRSRKPKPESYKGIHSHKPQYNLNSPPFNSMEGGFQPIVNPYENGYWKPERYNDSPQPKRNAFKHPTSLSPDNSRFRSLKNQSYSDFSRNRPLKTRDFSQQPYKKGIVENADPGKRPNRYLYSKWGNNDYKSDYFDNSNIDLFKSDYFTEPKGFDKGMHLVPKREVYKSKHQKTGRGYHTRKGQFRLANKKPKITSIYDVMAYGGTDWPKKIRTSNNDRKKYRKVMKGFSNRRYNEAKKKRSVLPFEGYFPDRMTHDQLTQRSNNQDSDYEYVNSK